MPAVLPHLFDDGHRIYVANVVPIEPGKLSIDQYNRILLLRAQTSLIVHIGNSVLWVIRQPSGVRTNSSS